MAEIDFGYYREDLVCDNLSYLSDLEALLAPRFPHLQHFTIRAGHYSTKIFVDVVLQRDISYVGSLDTYRDDFSSLLLKIPHFDPEEWWEAPKLFCFLKMMTTYDVKTLIFYIDGEPVCERPEDFPRGLYEASP